ncbi:MAG: dipeptidase [Arenicella sp.]|nr:dipeptidase [Arenicella sp.]
MKKILYGVGLLLIAGLVIGLAIGPRLLEQSMNVVDDTGPFSVTEEARQLHQSMIVADWHADSALWQRDLAEQSDYGHVDIPRLQQGNVALQMFTSVTKSPRGQNYERNESDASDNITTLALLQRWPVDTWTSLTARAVFQAEKIQRLAETDNDNFRLIKTKRDLADFVRARQSNQRLVGGLIGTEGSHALDGKLENIQLLFDEGLRMMGLQHFFDNKLGGSLHGTSQAGLTEFGRQALAQMQQLNIIVDLAHSSEQVVEDVLALSDRPLVVSHTGFKGHCDTPRNIRDDLMRAIADGGGLIAIGYWDGAVCGTHPEKIAEAIRYGIALVGAEHVALGSDYDGTVTTSFDTSGLVAITQALLDANVSEQDIRAVMGGNTLRFLAANLPE